MRQLLCADHVQNVYLLDPSLAWEEGQLLTQEQEMLKGGVEVLFFTRDAQLFLQAGPGDIVRFHRVEVDTHSSITHIPRSHHNWQKADCRQRQ